MADVVERACESKPSMTSALLILILVIWIGAIVVLFNVDRAGRFLWIPTLLALAGISSSILPLAIAPYAAVLVSGTILLLFIFSMAVLPRATYTTVLVRHVTR